MVFNFTLPASLATLDSRLAPAEGGERAYVASAHHGHVHEKENGLQPVGMYTVHGRFTPGRKPACGRWACTRALRALK